MDVSFDARDVIRVFHAYPTQSLRRLNKLIEGGAIDIQREMRMKVSIGATGETRRSINYRTGPLSAEIKSDLDPRRVAALEKGSVPHWTSAKPGTPLHRWAVHKGISPYAVQYSIAKKGTKAHPFIGPTYTKMRGPVQRDIINGFGRFIGEIDNGRI